MGTKARAFLLFTFAFSSALSLPETTALQSNASDPATNSSVMDCSPEGGCPGQGIEKRDASYDWDAALEDDPEKRSRIGFTGMRGKKSNDEIDDADFFGKRARMGFNGMRGKKEDEAGKRGPMAFHGMRGKKDGEYEEDYPVVEVDDEEDVFGGWDKRTMGFHGMRGRRMDEAVVVKRGPLVYVDSGEFLKRAMGFLGMRGKKLEPKRTDQFFGMKGKKAQSGFFGMRGKKSVPVYFELQGEPSDNEYDVINEGYSTGDRVRRGTNWLRNSKKAKSAFFAVRGKKAFGYGNGPEISFISSSE